MTKNIYLIANAHIDPIWQWELDEGLNCAISTFESALNLLDSHDYIFCHNEFLLYDFIQKVRPDLYGRIAAKIKEGKWHIMGGWFLQPDCNHPSGESFVRQIRRGLRGLAKLGKRPRVAANLDSFGHSKGLVQILVKSGYEGYLFQRPQKTELSLPAEEFVWEGLGGYKIPTVRISNGYNSPLGEAAEKIRKEIDLHPDSDNILVLWGVGNHGGGPSEKDLNDIEKLSREGEYNIYHATPELYFEKIDFDNAPTWCDSLQKTMPGCYTSLSRLKAAHRDLESLLYSTEKLLSAAFLQRGFTYDDKALQEAERALLLSEFHDCLPGTCIRDGEKECLDLIGHGKSLLRELRLSAINALALGLKATQKGDYSVVAFNPHPYPLTDAVQFEIMLADQNYGERVKVLDAYVDGKKVPLQTIKERSGIAIDWRKRYAVVCTLPPSGVSQIVLRERGLGDKKIYGGAAHNYEFKGARIGAKFGPEGFIEEISADGKTAMRGLIRPIVVSDSGDSWAMKLEQRERLGQKIGQFRLMTDEESARFSGTGKPISPLRVVEDGDVLTQIEGMYRYEESEMLIRYTFYKQLPYLDISARLFFNGADMCIKLQIPDGCKDDVYEKEIPFGKDELLFGGAEQPAGRFLYCGGAGIINAHACGVSRGEGATCLSLVRGAGYALHPIYDREYIPADRFVERMDQGVNEFSFRIIPACDGAALPRMAQAFCESPYAVYMSVSGTAESNAQSGIRLSNENIVMAAHRRSSDMEGKMLVRLHNNSAEGAASELYLGERKLADLVFAPFEIKTVLYDGESCEEIEELLI